MQCGTSDNVHIKEEYIRNEKKTSSEQIKHLILPHVSLHIVQS